MPAKKITLAEVGLATALMTMIRASVASRGDVPTVVIRVIDPRTDRDPGDRMMSRTVAVAGMQKEISDPRTIVPEEPAPPASPPRVKGESPYSPHTTSRRSVPMSRSD